MSNNTSNNKIEKNATDPIENEAVTGVEVVKDDTVVYEDGDFEDYNTKHDYQEEDSQEKDSTASAANNDKSGSKKSANEKSDKQASSEKANKNKDTSKNQQSSKEQPSEKDNKSAKDAKSNKDDAAADTGASSEDSKSAPKEEADNKDQSESEDSSNMTMAGMFQWASKIREDFISEATNITNEVTGKATAMTLQRLIAVVDMELAAFDKSVEVAKKLIANVEEERAKIASRKDKYQDMLDELEQE